MASMVIGRDCSIHSVANAFFTQTSEPVTDFKWRCLAPKLGVSVGTLALVKVRDKLSMRQIILRILDEWTTKKGKEATVEKLIAILERANFWNAVANQLREDCGWADHAYVEKVAKSTKTEKQTAAENNSSSSSRGGGKPKTGNNITVTASQTKTVTMSSNFDFGATGVGVHRKTNYSSSSDTSDDMDEVDHDDKTNYMGVKESGLSPRGEVEMCTNMMNGAMQQMMGLGLMGVGGMTQQKTGHSGGGFGVMGLGGMSQDGVGDLIEHMGEGFGFGMPELSGNLQQSAKGKKSTRKGNDDSDE